MGSAKAGQAIGIGWGILQQPVHVAPPNQAQVNKDARDWAKDYFTTHLTVITASEGDISAKIEKVLSSEGDVDVSQRKGKVITLFDVKVQLEYSGR